MFVEHMLESREHWALCVIERMGLSVSDPEGSELFEMINLGVASLEELMVLDGSCPDVPDSKLVLIAVGMMSNNRTAFERLRDGKFDGVDLLRRARQAARELAIDNDLESAVAHYDKLPEVTEEALMAKPTPREVHEAIEEAARTKQRH